MDPVSGAPWTGAAMSTPAPAPRALPKKILVGLILLGLGVIFAGMSYGWNYFAIRFGFASGIVRYIQIEITLGVIEYLCVELGLFFILWGILRILPSVLPWSRAGPPLILAGASVTAGMNLIGAVLVSLTYPPSTLQLPDWASYVLAGTLIAGSIVAALGLLLSLFAVAKGLLQPPTTPGQPEA